MYICNNIFTLYILYTYYIHDYMEVFQNCATPINWMVYNGMSEEEMDDWWSIAF